MGWRICLGGGQSLRWGWGARLYKGYKEGKDTIIYSRPPPLKSNKEKGIKDMDDDELLNDRDAAAFLGITKAKLNRDHRLGKGPKFIKIPGDTRYKYVIRYRVEDLREFAREKGFTLGKGPVEEPDRPVDWEKVYNIKRRYAMTHKWDLYDNEREYTDRELIKKAAFMLVNEVTNRVLLWQNHMTMEECGYALAAYLTHHKAKFDMDFVMETFLNKLAYKVTQEVAGFLEYDCDRCEFYNMVMIVKERMRSLKRPGQMMKAARAYWKRNKVFSGCIEEIFKFLTEVYEYREPIDPAELGGLMGDLVPELKEGKTPLSITPRVLRPAPRP